MNDYKLLSLALPRSVRLCKEIAKRTKTVSWITVYRIATQRTKNPGAQTLHAIKIALFGSEEKASLIRERYEHHRAASRGRGAAWQFTFPEWIKMWGESGRLHLRGPGGAGYCMARFKDQGPYSPTNVYICTNSQNCSDTRDSVCPWRKEVRREWKEKLTKLGIAPRPGR